MFMTPTVFAQCAAPLCQQVCLHCYFSVPGPGCLLGDGGDGVHLGRVVHHQVVIARVQGQSAIQFNWCKILDMEAFITKFC